MMANHSEHTDSATGAGEPVAPGPTGVGVDAAAVVEAVDRDVTLGLQHHLRRLRFTPTGLFADRGAVVDGPHAVVQWLFVGVDCCEGFGGMWNTGRQIEVHGVTVVDTSGDEWIFDRHVDWNSVNAQLGGSRGRAVTDDRFAIDRDAARANAELAFESASADGAAGTGGGPGGEHG